MKTNEDISNIYLRRVLIILTLIISFFAVSWTLNIKNSLVFDDYVQMRSAVFSDFKSLFKLFPTQTYNDRPNQTLFLKTLYIIFGNNYIVYHYIFVFRHLLNVYLVYLIVERILFQNFSDNSNGRKISLIASIAAVIFGANPTSLMAIQWIASSADFQCCNFALFATYLFLRYLDNNNYRTFYAIMSFFLYWISLRCKEMSLPFPIIWSLYYLYFEFRSCFNTKKNLYRFLKEPFLIIVNTFMLIYLLILIIERKNNGVTTYPDSPYYMSFSIIIMIRDFVRYMSIYFNPWNEDLSFSGWTFSSKIALCIFTILSIYTVYKTFLKKKFYLLLLLLICAGSFITVLPMKNMQHRLYMYIPSVFIAIWISLIAYNIVLDLKKIKLSTVTILIMSILIVMSYSDGVQTFKNWWLSVCQNDKLAMNSIEKIPNVPSNTHIYVLGAKNGYNIFYYGPGASLNLYYNDNSIITELVDKIPQNITKPYVIWIFKDGLVTEIDRKLY